MNTIGAEKKLKQKMKWKPKSVQSGSDERNYIRVVEIYIKWFRQRMSVRVHDCMRVCVPQWTQKRRIDLARGKERKIIMKWEKWYGNRTRQYAIATFLYAHSHSTQLLVDSSTQPNRPITHAMSIIMLRTTKQKNEVPSRILRSRRWFIIAVGYYVLYEKFIKLGKLRDGNLCASNFTESQMAQI